MTFSRKADRARALDIKIRRAKTMAKSAKNKDFAIQYPDEVREAQQKNFTKLTKRVTEDYAKFTKNVTDRRNKFAGK